MQVQRLKQARGWDLLADHGSVFILRRGIGSTGPSLVASKRVPLDLPFAFPRHGRRLPDCSTIEQRRRLWNYHRSWRCLCNWHVPDLLVSGKIHERSPRHRNVHDGQAFGQDRVDSFCGRELLDDCGNVAHLRQLRVPVWCLRAILGM